MPVTGRILLDSELPGLLPSLADADVIAVNPMSLAVVPERTAHGVGTTLLALGARPDADELWVAGTDARNRTRFEPVLKGRAVQNRLSVVGADGALRDVERERDDRRSLSAEDARAKLEALGYTQIGFMDRGGRHIKAVAVNPYGDQVEVRLDDTGRVDRERMWMR